MTATATFTDDQQRYLEGFFAGVKVRGVTFSDLAPAPATNGASHGPNLDDLTKEERIKHELNPLDAYQVLNEYARHDTKPEPEDVFRFKWNGLFWLAPVKDGYMCRLRIPGGVVRSYQLRELASIADDLTTGYIQITTRNNFQLRLIAPKDAPEVLRRIQGCGLHSKGSGADNIRNITANPTAGFDPYELIDVMPYARDLGHTIISTKEYYDLPRKFNIAYDGGGLISSVEDTNDIGATAVKIGENDLGIAPGIWFRIALGGVTGHQTFARDWGVIVSSEQLNTVILAIVRVFIRDGDRTNRKRARLKYLIEDRGLPAFLEQVEKELGFKLSRLPLESPAQLRHEKPVIPHSHVGIFPQTQKGLFYIGANVPVGQITSKQLRWIADLADNYGTGEIRLTVWQNFLIPNVPEAYLKTVCKQLARMGFNTEQSNLKSGFVACTGNRYCKFSSADTKGHAIELMNYLDKKIKLDQPINIHFTGCPNSCAQHYMGDIGLLGTKVKQAGESVEGYHIVIGGGFKENQKVGRQIFQNIAHNEVKPLVENMLKGYLRRREGTESFQSFCNRHDIGALQAIFTNNE
ncbi:MAG TPA: NirA family protein [Chthoniobacterales bacterium]